MSILGAVLAGGAARRFGSDKALHVFAGHTLIDHVIARLQQQADAIVICGRRHGPWTALDDLPHPGNGPLGGLAAALCHAARRGHAAVLTVPCDVPLLPVDALCQLAEARGPAFLRQCPVIGIWPVETAAALLRHLETQADRSVRGFSRLIGARAVDGGSDLVNINAVADLQQLERVDG